MLSVKANALYEIFEKHYLESGYVHSGMIPFNAAPVISFDYNVFRELIDEGLLQKRYCIGYAFELSIPVRKKLIDEHNLSEVWESDPYGCAFYPNRYDGEVARVNEQFKAFENETANPDLTPVYVAVFNSSGNCYDLLSSFSAEVENRFSKECSVSLVNGDTFCFRGLNGQEISDLMESTGCDYNYSYESPEDAWIVDENKVLKAVNIVWDVDDLDELDGLPPEIEIPEGIVDEDDISDYLSEVTGYCHKGFSLEECVKEELVHNLEPAKPSLLEQIKTASSRTTELCSIGKAIVIDNIPER